MTTRSDIEAQIADDLARTDIANQISDAVNTAIRSYRFERLGFNEAYKVTATLSTSADTMALSSISVRLRKIDRVRLVRSAGDYLDLYHRDYDWIMSRQDVRVTSQPIEYAIYNQYIHFDSIADTNYTLLFDGIKELGSAASASYSGGSTAAWFSDGRELVRHRAKRELYANVLKDMELAAAAGAAEKEALRIIKAELGEQISTGFIRPTEF